MMFFLVFARIVGMFLTAPVFNQKDIFLLAKVILIFWFSVVLIHHVPMAKHPPDSAFTFVLAAIVEVLIGVLIGFTADILVTGIELAGSLMDTQAGLSVASVLDPSSGRTITLMSLMLKRTAFVIFLLIDGHHFVLSAVTQSFRLLPIGAPVNLGLGALEVVKAGTYIFFLAVQLSAPIILVVFIIDFGFGVLNRVAEQINVFQLGFQVKPTISLLIFMATAPGIVHSIVRIMESVTEQLLKVFHALQVA